MARPVRLDQRDPPRLGPEDAWTPRTLDRRRLLGLPRVEQASRRENRPGRAETGMTAQLYTRPTRSRRTSYKYLKNCVQCATLIGTRGAAGRKKYRRGV